MILGRPTNLIIGAFTAVFNVIVLVLAALVPPIVIPAVVVGGINLAATAVIALIANQPPTLAAGDTYRIETPPGQPNYETTVAKPPAASKPHIDPS